MKSMQMIRSVLFMAGASLAGVAAAQPVLTGDAAKAKFPAALRNMGLETASWTKLTKGVEYMFGHFTNMYGYPDDAHFIKIDYANAPIKMKINEGALCTSDKLKTTSAAAKLHNALFAINGDMFRWSDAPNYMPYYFTKVDGEVVQSVASGGQGVAFNDDKTWTMGSWNATSAANWANVHCCEQIVANGKCTLEGDSWKKATPSAGFPFIGKTLDNILWVVVVDGRRSASKGITYYNGANLMIALGCDYAVLYDGGGSTTLVIRNDHLPEATLASTQHASEGSSDHTTMNYTINSSTLAERAVVDHLCFLDADKTIFVTTTGNDASANPYSSATPMKTLEAAYAKAVDGDTIYMAAGTYEATAPLTVSKQVTITGEATDLTLRSGANARIILDNDKATVSDLGIADVEMHCGNLVDCAVTNSALAASGSATSVSISAQPKGGTCRISGCIIRDNATTDATNGGLTISELQGSNGLTVNVERCSFLRQDKIVPCRDFNVILDN